MDKEVLKRYIKAGRVARDALEAGKRTCGVDVPYFNVVKKVEKIIRKGGAFPAFPVNVSVNELGAHYTPYPGDGKRFKVGDVVKIDVGCHVDGYIADNALTVELETNRYSQMIRAAEEALDMAIKTIRPGIRVKEVGGNIERVINAAGYRPIRNLTGHRMERYILHSGLSIPNIRRGREKIEEGMILAVEPFATDGKGKVENSTKGEIYILRGKRKLKGEEMIFYQWLEENFNTLPFASYWCCAYSDDHIPELRRLERRGAVMSYPLLIEEGRGKVSQREHTMLVTDNGVKVLTA